MTLSSRRICLWIMIGLSIFSTAIAPSASAYTNFQNNTVIENRPYYLPNESECSVDAVGDTSGIDASTGNNVRDGFKFFIDKGLTANQAAGVIGNLMWESAGGSGNLNPRAVQKGNVGRGIAQWSVGGRWDSSPGDNVKAYFLNNEDKYPAGSSVWTLAVQLDFVWYELTKTSWKSALPPLKKAKTLEDTTRSFMDNFEKPGVPHFDGRLTNAKLVIKKYGSLAPIDPTDDPSLGTGADGCPSQSDTANSGLTGDIVKTAMSGLAWPNPTGKNPNHNIKTPTATYRTAIVHPSGDDVYTDCGTFVSTVMHVSRVDTKYPIVGTGIQKAYVQEHTEKYKIGHPKTTGNLTPGDIVVFNDGGGGHTIIYVGEQGGKYPKVDASWHGHAPQRNTLGGILWLLKQPGVISATVIKK